MKQVTEDVALTAMCLWEEFLLRNEGVFSERREKVGAAEVRNEVMLLASSINKAYTVVAEQYNEPFDWEFVPAMLNMIEGTVNAERPISLTDEEAIKMAKSLIH